jgi:phosphocarrier protein HPr
MSASSETSVEAQVVLSADLHARPAGQVSKMVATFDAQVRLDLGDRTADARSVLAVMALGAVTGDTVSVRAGGAQAAEATEAVAAILTAAAVAG